MARSNDVFSIVLSGLDLFSVLDFKEVGRSFAVRFMMAKNKYLLIKLPTCTRMSLRCYEIIK